MSSQGVFCDTYARVGNKVFRITGEAKQPSTSRVTKQDIICPVRPHNSCSVRNKCEFINITEKPNKLINCCTTTDFGTATVSTSDLEENRMKVMLLSSPKILRQVDLSQHSIGKPLVYKNNDSVNPLKNHLDSVNRHQPDGLYSLRPQAKRCLEKSTNCRDYNINDQEFVMQTIEKNARLRWLVQKLVEARQREKESELNKSRDHCFRNSHNNKPPDSDYTQETSNQESKTKVYIIRPHSRHFQLSGVTNENVQENCETVIENHLTSSSIQKLTVPSASCKSEYKRTDTNLLDRLKKICSTQSYHQNDAMNKYESHSPIIRQVKFCQTNDYLCGLNKNNSKNTSIQTDLKQSCSNEQQDINKGEEIVIEKYDRKLENDERLKSKVKTNSPLANIELKLDKLLNSINTFIVEFQARKSSVYKNQNINATKSEPYRLRRVENIFCGMTTDGNSNTNAKNFEVQNKINYDASKTETERNNIILEEIENSKVTRDTDHETVNKVNPCKIPTPNDPRDVKSTKVSDSIANDKLNSIPSTPRRIITTAVNTEPLSILGLIRISKDTVKQLLSYMPSIDYHSYLPQFPRKTVRHYVCNICGAAFCRPSQLSDHITQAHAGNVKNCCACHHVLDDYHRSRHSLFSCRYCGQRFTRAYCCELHQQTCARRLGKRHDVSTSLMLLR